MNAGGWCRLIDRLSRRDTMVRMQSYKCARAMLIGAVILVTSVAHAAEVIRVAYAGSMGVVMDRFIGPAFAKANGVEFQGIGQGSYALARQLEGRLLQADVFLPITPGPIEILSKAGFIGRAIPVQAPKWWWLTAPKADLYPTSRPRRKIEKSGMRSC
jgi:molybdate/tungstate transport system substrate-binding protein